MDPDATRGSAGVGWLIAEEIVARAKVKVERPTFAGSEGLIVVTIKRQATLRLVCAYTELDREGFPVTDANKKEFVSRVIELADDGNTY